MAYTIGEMAKRLGVPASTLRYYDKQGLFPNMERVSGIRKFGDTEIEALRVIECLKKAGMEIKDIRQFMDWLSARREASACFRSRTSSGCASSNV